MNLRSISIFLVALNVGLLGTILYMVFLLQTEPAAGRHSTNTKLVTNTVTQIAVRKVNATNLLSSLVNQPLNWSAIESTNYTVYINNLRSFGCPEETIRDIILTDVAKLFAKRRTALTAREPEKFWRTGSDWEDSGGYGGNSPLQKQLAELDQEQRALVKELLGVDYQTELAKYWRDDNSAERMYGFLAPEKHEKLMEMQAHFEELEQAVYLKSKGTLLDEDHEELKKIEKQREAELAKVLTPAEMEEYQLRNSPTANNMRTQMAGFEPTEEEFRKIFRVQKTFDDAFSQAFDTTDEAQMELKTKAHVDAQEALNDEVKKVLGEKRFTEYQRAQDGDYRALVQMSERFELPKDGAGKVYEMKQEAERQKQRIDANPNLTDQQRQSALLAIARETEKSVTTTIGGKVFKAYRNFGGQWLQNLSVSDFPSSPETVPSPPLPPALPNPLFTPGVTPPLPKP